MIKNTIDSCPLSDRSESVTSNENLCVPWAYKLLMFGLQLYNGIVEKSMSRMLGASSPTSKPPSGDTFPVSWALSSFVSLYLLGAGKARAKLGRGDESCSKVWLYYII